ncbi:DUF4349 domain-containing protein [Streptomyces resistomycificus]|uniref:DUF4349 domain-containing protein n=1 Tax=Streptomyces resistomycificus TaxID=67356 RepID=UPI000B0C8C7D|nr:DUF4349 domain-containing protein [Streptomyces resistomycificus]
MRTQRSVRSAQALAGILLAAALALTGCSGAGDSASGAGEDAGVARSGAKEAAPGAAADSDGGAGSGAQASAPPKVSANRIIRTAELTVQVKDVSKALGQARTTTENAGGYIGNESTSTDSEGREETHVVLRVPVDRYEEVLGDLEGTGKLRERSAKARDVTDQVVDVESRITSQRASVVRIRELMDQATKLSDVVTLEGELSSRQAELESLLARQASLKDRTSMATITLSLSETPVREAAEDDDPGVVDALAGGWDAFVTMLRWILVALAAVLPFAAVVAVYKRQPHRRPRSAPCPPPGPLRSPGGRTSGASRTEMPCARSVFA